jgi:hypothetical protein
MGKKSGPAPPPAPDPYATAQAQAGVNKQAAITQANLNRINQVTPEGSLTYTQNGMNADGTPQYTQTQTYSPEEQQKYEQANKVAISLNDLAGQNISRVQQAQSTPFSYAGMQDLQTQFGQNNPFQLQTGPGAGPTQGRVAGVGTAQAIDPSLAGKGIQSNLDYGGLTNLPGTNDYGAEGQKMADSVYAQAASRLDPRYQQMDSDQQAKLAAQGISENSDAYRRDTANLARDRTDAYNQAAYSAQGAGAAEQSRLFGLAMGARQQGQNEVNTQGQFANSAQTQGFGQQLSAADQAAQVQNQNVNQRLSAADLFNQAQQQKFAQGQTAAGTNNATQNQYYNQASGEAAFQNNARQQQIEQAAYLRNLPLNDISALLSGNQPNAPNFSGVPQVGVQAPDYQGIVQSNYGQAVSQYNQQQAARSQMLGSIFGGLGTLGAAFAPSDIRFKENIKRIGTLANGLATYAFNYIGSALQQFGVMAQEVLKVRPEAVAYDSNGFMYVDYGKVYS